MGVNIRQIEKTSGSGYRLTTKNDGSWYAVPPTDVVINTYVDPINGDNSNGKVGTHYFPFKDPWAAVDAIESLPSSQEYTLFWLPGEYTVGDDAGNLKVTTNVAEGNLHSNTHVINHYLFRGAKLEVVTNAVNVSLFIPATGQNTKIRILGEGSIIHNREASSGLLGAFLDDTGLSDSETVDLVLHVNDIQLSGATWGPYITSRRHIDADIRVHEIANSAIQTLLYISPNATVAEIEANISIKADKISGTQSELIRTVGNTAATQGLVDSTIDIDFKSVDITASGPLVNIYRALITNSVIQTKIGGKAARGNAAGALVNIQESPLVDSTATIQYEGLITDLDTISRIDTVSTDASPHPTNNNQITIIIKNLLAELNGSQGSTPLINYIYDSAQLGTKVDIHVDAVLNDRLFFTLRENQDVTITGNIKSNGTASPILIGEALTDDANYKKLLKDLFIDAATPIDVNGYTGSKIYTANYTDRNSVTVTTL